MAEINLSLTGDLESKASSAAGAVDDLADSLTKLGSKGSDVSKLTSALGPLGTAFQGVKSKTDAMAASFDSAVTKTRALKNALVEETKAAKDAAAAASAKEGGGIKGAIAGAGAGLGSAFKGLGKILTGPLDDILKSVGPAAGKALSAGASAAGGALKAAAAVGAASLAAAAVAWAAVLGGTAAFIKLGVEETSKKELRNAVFGALGGEGEAVTKLAVKYGLDEGQQAKAEQQMKGLLAAKFSQTEVEATMKIAIGIGAVDEGKAQSFVDKMKVAMAKGGKASEETIQGFAEAGIATEDVWKNLAGKLGVSVEKAKEQVKAGKVDTKTALEAVTKTADSAFGGLGDKAAGSVPGLLASIKTLGLGLFSGFELGPLKGFLGNVKDLFGGPEGQALAGKIGELGSKLIKTLFGPFEGEAGKAKLAKFFDGATQVVDTAIRVLTKFGPHITAAIETVADLGGKVGTVLPYIEGWFNIVEKVVSRVRDVFTAFGAGDYTGGLSKLGGLIPGIMADIVGGVLGIDLTAPGQSLGDALVQGLAGAISAGYGAVVDAAASLCKAAINAGKSALGVASPSKEFAFLGDMSAQGMTGAMSDNATSAAEAGRKLAGASLEGAKGASSKASEAGAGAAPPSGAGGGGDSITITINVGGGAGGAEQAKSIAAEVERMLRDRDRRKAEQGRAA